MSLIVEFLPEARFEFDDAADWYEEQKAGLRAEFVKAVDLALVRIARSPLSYPIVEGTSTRRALLHRFPYSIIYSIESERLTIFAIFHNSRNPLIWRGRIG